MAAMLIPMRRVRPAIAAAIVTGAGTYPSSAPWCSDRMTKSMPRSSPHLAWSRQAAYNSAWVADPQLGARRSYRRPSIAMARLLGSAGEVRPDLGAEALDLVAQLVDRARLEAHLEVRHTHRAILVHRFGQLLGRSGDRAARNLPDGLADVHRLGDHADLGLGAGAHLVPARSEVRDRVRHLLAWRPLRDPAVAARRDPPERGAARPA